MFVFENAMERGIRKVITFVKLKIASKIFEKINTETSVFSRRLKFP